MGFAGRERASAHTQTGDDEKTVSMRGGKTLTQTRFTARLGQDGKAMALMFVAFFCYSVWIHFNFTSYQFMSLQTSSGMGLAYDASVYANGAAMLLAAVLAGRLSGKVFDSGVTVASAFLCSIGTLLSMTTGAFIVSNAAVEIAAGIMTGVGSAVVVMMLAFTMLHVRDAGVLCVFAFLLANAVCSFVQWLPAIVLLVLVIMMPIATMLCTFVVCAPGAQRDASGAEDSQHDVLGDVPGENVRVMVPLLVRAGVFVLVAFGGLSVMRVFAQSVDARADSAALLLATLAFGVLLAFSIRGERESLRSVALFRIVFLTSLVGLFCVPFFEGSFGVAYGIVAVFNTLIRAFVFVIEYRVCVKTKLSPLVVFGIGECVKKVPTLVVRSVALFMPVSDFMAEPMVHIKLFVVAGVLLAFVYVLVFTEEHMVQLCVTDASAVADNRAERGKAALAAEFSLTERETEVLDHLCDQRTAGWIADKLFISTSTVNVHIKNIYRKCNVHSRQDLLDLLESKMEES